MLQALLVCDLHFLNSTLPLLCVCLWACVWEGPLEQMSFNLLRVKFIILRHTNLSSNMAKNVIMHYKLRFKHDILICF